MDDTSTQMQGGTPANPAQVPYTPPAHTASRIIKAANRGFKALENDVRVFELCVKEFRGPWSFDTKEPIPSFGDRDPSNKRPINLIGQMVEVWMANLVGTNHTPRLKPTQLGARGRAKVRSRRLDQLKNEINLHRTHSRATQDLLLNGTSFYYCGLRAGSDLFKVDGELRDPGQPFVQRISPGDITRDPESRDADEDQFIGHRMRVNLAHALETGIGNADVLIKLPRLGHGTDRRDETAPFSARGQTDDTINDIVECWNVIFWDGRQTMECVVPTLAGADSQFVIEPRPYQGPERGPYEICQLREINNRTSGISPGHRLLDLHLALAGLGTEIIRQIMDYDRKIACQKSQSGEEFANDLLDKAKRIMFTTNPEMAKEFETGGVAEKSLEALAVLLGLAANEGVNLQQTAGNKSAANTAAEATILAGRASTILSAAKGRPNQALCNVYRRLSWFLDQEDFRREVFSERLSGGQSLELRWDPDTREGTYQDFEYEVDVEELDQNDPNMEKVRTLEMLKTMPGVVAGVVQTKGDPQAAIRIASDTFNKPELDEIWTTPQAMMVDQALAQATPQPKPPTGVSDAANPVQPQNQMASDYSREVRV